MLSGHKTNIFIYTHPAWVCVCGFVCVCVCVCVCIYIYIPTQSDPKVILPLETEDTC